MSEIEKIYDAFYLIEPDDKSRIIKFYEENRLTLENRHSFIDVDDFKEYMIIIVQYVISLETLGKYSKAITYSDKALKMILENLESYDIPLKDYKPYWSTMTSKGRAHYNLKNYEKAIECFEKLVKWDSEYDNLKNWLTASKREKRNAINKYLYISATLVILIDLAIGKKLFNYEIRLIIVKLALLAYVAAIINEYFYERIIQWMKK